LIFVKQETDRPIGRIIKNDRRRPDLSVSGIDAMAVAMRQRFAFPLEIAAKSFSCSRVTPRQPEATHAQFVSKKKKKEYLTSALEGLPLSPCCSSIAAPRHLRAGKYIGTEKGKKNFRAARAVSMKLNRIGESMDSRLFEIAHRRARARARKRNKGIKISDEP